MTAAALADHAAQILRLDAAAPAAPDPAIVLLATCATGVLAGIDKGIDKSPHLLTPLPGDLPTGASKRPELPPETPPAAKRGWWSRLLGR